MAAANYSVGCIVYKTIMIKIESLNEEKCVLSSEYKRTSSPDKKSRFINMENL